jgi:gamma-glutamyltranspeptidase/glutathione hydrolase
MKLLLLVLTAFSLYIEATIFNSKAIVHPEVGKNGMVVSQHYLATNAGHSILAEGGNAYDASIAVAFALAVVLPRAGNIVVVDLWSCSMKLHKKAIALITEK